jgi:hypothetical protein
MRVRGYNGSQNPQYRVLGVGPMFAAHVLFLEPDFAAEGLAGKIHMAPRE